MNRQETYEAWRQRRSHVEIDGHFADRVMEEIRRPPPARLPRDAMAGSSWFRLAAAALLLVSVGIGLLRLGSVIALILFTCSEGF